MEHTRIVKLGFFLTILLGFSVNFVSGQTLKSPTASFSEPTVYPLFSGKDSIFYFCGIKDHQSGSLKAASSGQTVTFVWEKLNPVTGNFSFLSNETAVSSVLNNLSNGCYRVSFRENGVDYILRAWVMNSWVESAGSVTSSNCEYFQLHGSATGPDFIYYDLSSRQAISLDPLYKYVWYSDGVPFAAVQDPFVDDPPTKNTIYKLTVTSRARCAASTNVTYESIVTKAKFSWTTAQKSDPEFTNPQAPLEVKFVNESENGDSGKYEWFLFKEKSQIEEEAKTAIKLDSIMERLATDNPTYTYEYTGRYMVKLVSVKQSPGYVCRDTFYLENYIVIDTSLVKVAPAFTPNGDGVNDELIIKTRSLESLDFQVFNRWGRTVHHYRKNGYIPEDAELAVWDGKVNGKQATPGVYFYVVDAQGRDGARRRKKGFVQLIW
jgi:gliding motility-associated-like protein